MSESEKLFPNATARPWEFGEPTGEVGIVEIRKGSRLIAIVSVGEDVGENVNLIRHAVYTYDARDAALREALEALRGSQKHLSFACSDEQETHDQSRLAIAKIESVMSPGGAAK
jgi:hypothetical protein